MSRLSECYESNTCLFGLLLLVAAIPVCSLSVFSTHSTFTVSAESTYLLISLSTCASLSVDALQRVSKEGLHLETDNKNLSSTSVAVNKYNKLLLTFLVEYILVPKCNSISACFS